MGGISVLSWYKMILRVPEKQIKFLVDRYNEDALPANLRRALEIVDGLLLED